MTAADRDGGDVFASIFAQLAPEQLFADPRANGAGVRIAVIDSGIDRAMLESRFEAAGTPIERIEGAIFRVGQPTPLPYLGQQSASHGTTVADILLTLAPRAQLFSADVFGADGNCDVETVIRAIRHAIDVWNCKIINLSLGVTEQRLQPLQRRQQLHKIIEESYFRDVLVFAAAHNDHPFTKSYPSAFSPPLISVNKGPFKGPLDFAYVLSESIEFQAFSQGYLGPFAREAATSWATPHLAGITARILSLRPSLKPFEIKTILYWMSQSRLQLEATS